jgi:hypothetical protein
MSPKPELTDSQRAVYNAAWRSLAESPGPTTFSGDVARLADLPDEQVRAALVELVEMGLVDADVRVFEGKVFRVEVREVRPERS